MGYGVLCLILGMRIAMGAIPPPVLDTPLSPTEANPQSVTGTTTPNRTVRLYVNSDLQQSTQSGSDGRFTFPATFIDGVNTLYSTQYDGSEESAPSNTITIHYTNALSRTQGGRLNQDAVWTPGSGEPYVITTNLIVSNGVTLTLKAGTTLKFASGVRLQVNGTLKVEGTEANPVTFTSNSASPAARDWNGIRIDSDATNVVIDHAVIEYATNGVFFNTNSTGTVRDSLVRHHSIGVYFSTASTGTLTRNLIQDNTQGILVREQATPHITDGNEITANVHGLYAQGNEDAAQNPNPIVTSNSFHDNSGYHYRTNRFGAPATTTLDATGNWWGTTDPIAIAAKIYDYHDNPSASPTVDFSGYLDEPDGDPAAGGTLAGTFTSDTTLVVGTYTVSGNLTVAKGVTLTLKAGTLLKFESGLRLRVNGTLKVEGTKANPVTFTSSSASPAAQDWSGIRIDSDATDVVIDHALIEYATNGVLFNLNSAGTVRNSVLRHNNVGVYFHTASTGTLTRNLIQDNTYGILVREQATPQITDGNEIAANVHGLYAQGNEDATQNPNPVVTGNRFHDNSGYHYRTNRFGAPATTTLNATGNWWGTTDSSTIAAKIYDYHDNPSASPTVDFGNYLDGPDGNPVPNTAPAVTINSPASGSSFTVGATISLSARATDAEDGDRSNAIRWFSDLDGALGTGADLSISTLSIGTHTITAAVTDRGSLSTTATITLLITVAEGGTPPLVIITAPRTGGQFPQGVPITFRASATDAQAGDLGVQLQWSSDVDGVLGTGATLTLDTLTVANHTITARVTNASGMTAQAQRSLSVITPLSCTPLKSLQVDGARRFGPRPR